MSSIDREFSEKRHFIRMRINSSVNIYLNPNDDEALVGQCKDLSASGMCIRLDEPLELGTELTVVIPSSSDQFAPLRAKAIVQRCDGDQEKKPVTLGLEIVEID